MVGATVIALAGCAVVPVVALCARGRIGRNHIAGIRVPAFFASDRAWRVGHRAATAPVTGAAALTVIVAIVAEVIPAVGELPSTLVGASLVLAGLIAGAVRGSAAIDRDADARAG